MANEITLQYSLNLQNPASGSVATGQAPLKDSLSEQLQITQSAVGLAAGVMAVPVAATGTALPISGVSTPGYLLLRNLDTTNYVQFGVQVAGTFYPLGRLKPGEMALYRLDSGASLYLRANTAAVNVQYKLLND